MPQSFFDLLPILCAVMLYAVRVREFFVKRNVIKGEISERATFLALLISGTLVVFASTIEYIIRHLHFNTVTFILGVLVATMSFAIRAAAVKALDRMWSIHVEIRKEHQLVKTGPFRWVRHPIYLAAILELVAAMLVTNASFTAILFLVGFLPCLYFRMRLEEKKMINQFGDQYRAYMRVTPALIPLRIPHPKS